MSITCSHFQDNSVRWQDCAPPAAQFEWIALVRRITRIKEAAGQIWMRRMKLEFARVPLRQCETEGFFIVYPTTMSLQENSQHVCGIAYVMTKRKVVERSQDVESNN